MVTKLIYICIRRAVHNPNDDIIRPPKNLFINFNKQWLHNCRCELKVTAFTIFNPFSDEQRNTITGLI